MFSERSGVVNIGLEGMMLMGAFFAVLADDKTDSWIIGLAVGILSGGVAALVYAFFAIHLRADQILGGTAINFLCLGLTGYLYIDIYGTEGTAANTIQAIPDIHLSFLDGVPFLGPIFAQVNLMIWLALLLVVVSSIVMLAPDALFPVEIGVARPQDPSLGFDAYATATRETGRRSGRARDCADGPRTRIYVSKDEG